MIPRLVLGLAFWLGLSSLVLAAEPAGTGLQDCLGRAVQAWGREVQAGRGSRGAWEERLSGRASEALEAARRDGDGLGAALLEATLLLEGQPGRGADLARVAGALEGRVEPLLLAWLRFHAGMDLLGSGRIAEGRAQLEESVALFRQGGNPEDLGEALKQAAGAQLLAGRALEASRTYAEAADLARARGRTAEEAVLVGMRARALADLGQLAEAVRLYRESLPVLEKAGQEQRALAGHSDLGTVLMRQGRYAEAEVEMDAALRYFEAAGPPELALAARINRAGLDLERGFFAEAEARLRSCLSGALDPNQEAAVRSDLAQVLVQQGRYPEAQRALEELIRFNAERGAELSAVAARSALGSLFRQQKRLAEAERVWTGCLEARRRLGNPLGEAGELANLGNLRLNQGRPAEAEEFFRQALALCEALGAQAAAASARQNLSGALMARGRCEEALEALEQARAGFERLGHRSGWCAAIFKTAVLKLSLGQRREALRLLEQVEEIDRRDGLQRALVDLEHLRAWLEEDADPQAAEARLARVAEGLEALGIPGEAAGVRAELANLALGRGETRKAAALARRALEAWKGQDLPLERLGATLVLAWAAAAEGNLDQAAGELRAVREEARLRGVLGVEALAAGSLARVELLAGRPSLAREAASLAEAAGAAIQKDRFYAGGEQAAVSELYPFHGTVVQIERALGRPDRALEALERGRGRLLEVARLRTLQAATTPQARALLERLQLAQVAVLGARDALSRAAPSQRTALEAELDRASAERDRLEVALSQLTRTWDQLRDPSAASVRGALPEGTALLEYAFLDEGLQVFLVTREGISWSMLLPAPAPAGPAERFLAPLLEARTRRCAEALGAERLVARIREGTPEEAQGEARRLWEVLLAPLEGRLQGVNHLLVIPDRELHFLPFEALQDRQGRWLLERFTVTYLNTARELFPPPAPGPSGAGPPLVVGGPLYSLPGQQDPVREEILRLGGPWAALAGARREAEAVAHREGVPARTGQEASEAAFKGQAPGARALHLATHGFVGAVPLGAGTARIVTRSPQDVLGDCGLVLAGANGGGEGREDGILTALEVLGLDLGRADLVVLSACDTGRGQVNASEGVYGLKRSFLAAGARQVVFSLWPVSDRGTLALMSRFYEHLGRGLGPSEALRAARLELLRGDPILLEEGLAEEPEEFQGPFYWAPFAVVGWPSPCGRDR